MTRPPGDPGCRCGHAHAAHEHYRRGSDCALCGCPRFAALAAASPSWLPRFVRRARDTGEQPG